MAKKINTADMSAQEYIEYKAAQAAKKPGKYNNKWVMYDGINFQSAAERNRYIALKHLEASGEIKRFTRQRKFQFIVNEVLITSYTCDFVVYTNEGGIRVEDVKGTITDEYLIKKRLMLALYDVQIYEPNLSAPATRASRHKYKSVKKV